MKSTGKITTLIISTMAAIFAISVIAMIAYNPAVFSSDTLFSYDTENGILTVLGETIPISPETVRAIAEYPRRAGEFVGRMVVPDF